ncbi:MAG: prepilin-type N-terminal cleavage/methylation domain-containing protein [Desulfuromonadales bacterium]|nr:prepilin-type N-terminal cleavage/methylation domain-containing protein [Desulfuromonadales bacterium]
MSNKEIIKRESGFTLIEMMIALFILSVSILALTAVTITSMKVNLENDARNAAVRLTSEVTDDVFAIDFDDLKTLTTPLKPKVRIRGAEKEFTVNWTVTDTTATLKQVVITVSYDIKGKTFSNQAVIYRPSET